MKILLMSYAYAPSMGGIEVFSASMRQAFLAAGHEVRVVTETPSDVSEPDVLRRPDKAALRAAIEWADICFVSGVSLRYQIPALLANKPIAITHHTWLHDIHGKLNTTYRIKLLLTHFALNIAVSHALARHLNAPTTVIHNPMPEGGIELGAGFAERERDLLFVGRLVSDKGVNVLLDAVATLHASGKKVTAAIAGTGELAESLQAQAREMGLGEFVRFTGRLAPAQVHELMRTHRMLIVPSLWKEPYPMVTFEALSKGAIVLGSHMGGLPEGIGPCGETFPMGDSRALAEKISNLLDHPEQAEQYRANIPEHLAPFSLDQVAARYLHVFELLVKYHPKGRRRAIRKTLES